MLNSYNLSRRVLFAIVLPLFLTGSIQAMQAGQNIFFNFYGITGITDVSPITYTNGKELPFELQYKGIVEVSEDDRMITSITPGGFVEINKTSFGNNRRLFIHSNEQGQLTYEYFVGKTKTAFEPEGEKWLGEILPEIVKNSDLGLESRVNRIYREKGLAAVFAEARRVGASGTFDSKWSFFTFDSERSGSGNGIKTNALKTLVYDNRLKNEDLAPVLMEMAHIRSNSTKGTLIRYLLENYPMNNKQLEAALKATATHEYNTERGSTLRVFNNFYSDDFTIRKNYFDIVNKMEINSEKGNVLKDLVKKKTLSSDTWISLLTVVNDFSSEREKGAVLLYCIAYLPNNEEVMKAFSMVLDGMSHNYYVLKGEITNTLLEANFNKNASKTDKAALLSYLKTAVNISSNSQKGQILRKANRLFINDDEVTDAYFNILDGMDSDMEKYNVMIDLLNQQKLSHNTTYRLLRTTYTLVPDFQHGAGAVLRELIRHFPLSENNTNQFFQIIERMDQNSTIEELLRLVIDHPSLNNKMLIRVMECSQRIEVDVERAAVLVRLSPQISGKDGTVKYLFKTMAKELDSEYEKNRVLKTIL